MSIDLIKKAVETGAKLFGNVSGGKDSQAMVKVLMNNNLLIDSLVHADLGRVEWKESHSMCEKLAAEAGVKLHVIKRSDGRDLIDHWQHRLNQLKDTGKPFWSSAVNRYCTSDMKRDPINKFFRNCGEKFIISCEGIRAEESKNRAKKEPLTIRHGITSVYYKGMTVEHAIACFNPRYRLALTWYPIFNYTKEEVWETYGMTSGLLYAAQVLYKQTKIVPKSWPFHPAYVYGNERVSCVFCILGCNNDLQTGAVHRPELLNTMIEMEEMGNATFKQNWSLKQLKQ